MQSKNKLRALLLNKRAAAKKDSEAEKKICRNILESELYRRSEKVFLYACCGSEADIDSIIEASLESGKSVALPLCLDDKGNMEFRFINSLSDLKRGMYSIREPDTAKCEKADFDSKTVCLVPAVCFDKNGYRIGYGKGYYDRFLKHFNGISVGVCFESCLLQRLPADEHDRKVNYLLTDNKLYQLTRRNNNG